jgi:hypothetical protein
MARYCRLKRMRYQLAIANYQPEQFVFVDETRKDDRTTYRRRGRARRGYRAESRVQFVRGVGYSVLPALTIDGFLSAEVVEGAFTKETFQRFILREVVHFMNPYPGKNSILVMDNCQIHKSRVLARILRGMGMRVMFLPPYSPDYNPIEEAFSCYKAWIRRQGDVVRSYPGSPKAILLRGLYESVSVGDIWGFYKHCGYVYE